MAVDGVVGFEGALDDAVITESQHRAKLNFVQCYANCERHVQTPLGIPRNQRARAAGIIGTVFIQLGPLKL